MTINLALTSSLASPSLVPGRFDLILDGHGYKFWDALTPSLPFRSQRASYSFSPTFVERTNVQGNYGDDQQAFFLTASQNDWSLGEQQKFMKSDADSQRSFWQGTNIDITTPGQVSLRQAVDALTFTSAVRTICPRGQGSSQNIIAASSTNLYEVDPAGTITDRSAHGLGAAPSRFGSATDGTNVYVSTTSAGTVGVRKWTGAAYSTWSATPADSLEFLNNSLYGLRSDTAELNVYDTSGTATQRFQWKDATGADRKGSPCRIKAFGGKLLILWSDGPSGPELWIYDGVGCQIAMILPKNFWASDIEVVFGSVFISGSTMRISNGNTSSFIGRPAIYYWANGSEGKLWEANSEAAAVSSVATAGHPSLAAYGSGMIFNDDTRGDLCFYEAASGGIHSIGTYTVAGDTPTIASTQQMVLNTRNQTTAYMFPDTTTIATTGTVESSLFEFDSSLTKYFKSISVDVDIPSGASIDIAYQVNSHDAAWTTVVTGAAAGTEYTIGQNARSLAYRITLNKGTAATSPTLKRVYVRGAPILTTFNLRSYVLDLTQGGGQGPARVPGDQPMLFRDGTPNPKNGQQMAADLIASAQSTTPITITDRFGTFTGIIEPSDFEILELHPQQYVAKVTVRQV